jgi:hypothetical protein
MMCVSKLPARLAVALLAAGLLPAQAEDRTELRACQAMVDRAAQDAKAADAKPEDAELVRCRQIVREWMLRDARRSVDEQGRPLR